LLQKITVVDDVYQVLDQLLVRGSQARVVSFCNAHAVNLAAHSREFLNALLESDLLLRDGVGVKLAMQLLGMPAGVNANGTDLIPRLLAALPSTATVVLYGTSSPWLERAVAGLRRTGVTVADSLNGFLDEHAYVDNAAELHPDLIILGMGMPKQEMVARALRRSGLTATTIMNGGAILDFVAGRHPRAPLALRRCGLEWLFRLAREPARLWERYLVGNAQFVWRVISAWTTERLLGRRD
jgi:exopolysaccharide biosynthesis WecB/TagA/CpsF family protein